MKRRKLFPENRKNKTKHSDGPDADYGMAKPLFPKRDRRKKNKIPGNIKSVKFFAN